MKPRVLITGVSGYLGSHVCDAFLKSGRYQVRGTVRSLTNESKINPLQKAFGSVYSELELMEADLLNPSSLTAAVQGCDYVVHTASPFPSKIPKDENVLIKPAVEGTLSVLKEVQAQAVKRVVVTSSVAAIYMQNNRNGKTFTENDWSEESACPPYHKSKLLAERAAWDYFKQSQESFDLVTINPSFIVGPSFISTDFTSGQIIQSFMTRKVPLIPPLQFGVVDVRDVALAHLRAIEIEEAKNKRFILSAGEMWSKELAQLLRDKFGEHYRISLENMPYFLAYLLSLFSAEVKTLLSSWGVSQSFDNRQSREILGIEYRDIRDSFVEMVYSMMKQGLIPMKIEEKDWK